MKQADPLSSTFAVDADDCMIELYGRHGGRMEDILKRIYLCIFILFLTALLVGCVGERQGSELPMTDAPETEVPATDAPDTEPPATEAPETDAPAESNQWIQADFADGQLYAVAYIGYREMPAMDFYLENYLDGIMPPVHYVSGEEYYLIIPRYKEMDLTLYQVDMLEDRRYLRYEEQKARPFIVVCNVSDIMPDVEVQLTYEGQTYAFSPYISLKDGSVQMGEWGLNIGQE